MKRTLFTLLVFLLFLPLNSQVKVWEEPLSIPTYEVKEPDRNPFFFRNEVYQGASKVVYPYALMDNLGSTISEKKYRSLNLENEYIRIVVLPELGGKLYDALDKTNNYHFLYRNHVIKPANIGMLGAWTSGGIEWCVVHHHRASSFLPVDHFIRENEDGSRTIFIGETELRHRMRWTVALTVFPGKSYVRADVKIVNRTPETHSFLYWANVATNANENYRVIFPRSTRFAVYHAKNSFTQWPISHEVYNGIDYTRGVDLSWWKNHPVPVSFFAHDLQEDFMGGYDYGKDAGTVHVGNHNIVKGAKLWEWGPGEEAQMWDKVLTDKDGPYAEIMVGAFSDNQPDYSWIRPYEVKTVTQFWYPMSNIGGFKTANLDAALNMEVDEKGEVLCGACGTGTFPAASLQLFLDGKLLLRKEQNIDPGNALVMKAKVAPGTLETRLSLLLLDHNGDTLNYWHPVTLEPITGLPAVVKPPPAPSQIATNEELFLAGQRIQQFYNPTLDPLPYMQEALSRDSLDSRVNTWMGNEAFGKWEYEKAALYFRKALQRITANYTRPADAEAWYGLGLALKAQENYTEATNAFYRAGWDQAWHAAASYQLAEIFCTRQDFVKAFDEIQESLSLNTKNTQAVALCAAILRHLGRTEEALSMLNNQWLFDPLDFRIGNEYFLNLRAAGKEEEARNAEIDLENRMHGNMNAYLELADDYCAAGLNDDGLALLKGFVREKTGENIDPQVYYTLGFLSGIKGDVSAAKEYITVAGGLPVDYVFPYIPLMQKILKSALALNPSDSKAWYYLGNLLFDRQPQAAMNCWENAVNIDPHLAVAYRNLGWGNWYSRKDLPAAIENYERAIIENAGDPVYFYELDRLYARARTPVEKRLAMLEPNHTVLQQRDDALLREIMLLNLGGKPEKSVEYLSSHSFHIREGDMSLRDINVDAHLLLGKKMMEQGKYKDALLEFERAGSYPENHQVGKPINDDRQPQIWYLMAQAAKKTGDRKTADACLRKAAAEPGTDGPWLRYPALALHELGQEPKALEAYQTMLEQGKQLLQSTEQIDYFAKFGEQKSREESLAMAHYLMALGYQGLGQKDKARQEIETATTLWNSNPWANDFFNELMHPF
jgi:tetratricopeptide (TPR) repeat protein